MLLPEIIKHTVTCPSCRATVTVEAVHFAHQRVFGSRDRIYKSSTWQSCEACGCEWEIVGAVQPDKEVAA